MQQFVSPLFILYSEIPCFAQRRASGGVTALKKKKQVFVKTAHLVTRQLIPLLYSMNKKRISIKVRSSTVFLNLKVMIRPSRQIMRWFKVSVFIDASLLMVYLKSQFQTQFSSARGEHFPSQLVFHFSTAVTSLIPTENEPCRSVLHCLDQINQGLLARISHTTCIFQNRAYKRNMRSTF